MGLGFPLRFLRSTLGPTLEDEKPVENPKSQIPAEALNALFRQVAGMNVGAARVSLVAEYNGSDFDIDHQSEAWNPDEELAHPVLERTSTGVYTYTFQGTYPDETGVDVTTVLAAPRISIIKELTGFADRVEGYAWIDSSSPVVHIRIWDATGTPVDEPFWLEVL